MGVKNLMCRMGVNIFSVSDGGKNILVVNLEEKFFWCKNILGGKRV